MIWLDYPKNKPELGEEVLVEDSDGRIRIDHLDNKRSVYTRGKFFSEIYGMPHPVVRWARIERHSANPTPRETTNTYNQICCTNQENLCHESE